MDPRDDEIDLAILGYMNYYPQDPKLRELVHRRRVALVGPADTLKGSGAGKQIDDHDVVARMNLAAAVTPDVHGDDYGWRLDLLWITESVLKENFSTGAINQSRTVNQHYPDMRMASISSMGLLANHRTNAPWFLYPGSPWSFYAWDSYGACVETVEHRWITHPLFVFRDMLGGFFPRVGFVALLELLLHGATVDLYAMTFYFGGGHIFYETRGPLGPRTDHCGKPTVHDGWAEVDVVRRLLRLFPGRIVFGADCGLDRGKEPPS